VTYLVVDLDNY